MNEKNEMRKLKRGLYCISLFTWFVFVQAVYFSHMHKVLGCDRDDRNVEAEAPGWLSTASLVVSLVWMQASSFSGPSSLPSHLCHVILPLFLLSLFTTILGVAVVFFQSITSFHFLSLDLYIPDRLLRKLASKHVPRPAPSSLHTCMHIKAKFKKDM